MDWWRSADPELIGLIERGYAAFDAKDWPQAGELLSRAAPQVPAGDDARTTWFDAALAFKFARDWKQAYELGRHACATVERGRSETAYWNLGIAATALREWGTARDAWAGYGLELPAGDGEIVTDLGVACVRIDTGAGQEVVWARRICPARARVISVPFNPARRFGEVVLHDGTPNGERVTDWGTVPVFDELALFTASSTATLSVTITVTGADDVEALCTSFASNDYGVDALGSGVNLCACCSESSVGSERTPAQAGEQNVLIGAPEEQARRLLDEWSQQRPADRLWTNLHLAR